MSVVDLVILLVGIPFGVIASIIGWFVLNAYFTPRIEFSRKIARRKNGNYEVKVRNLSRFRDVVDLQVGATVRLVRPEERQLHLWDIRVSNEKIRSLPRKRIISREDPRRPRSTGYRRLVLDLQSLSSFARSFLEKYDPAVLEMIDKQQPTALEALLRLGKAHSSFLRFEALGFDSLTGVRRYFESAPMRSDDVRKGRFGKGDSFEIQAD